MTESVAWMAGPMGFLAPSVVALLVTVNVYGTKASHRDHPHAPAAVRRALVEAAAGPALPSVAQRGGDAVEDVGLADHEAREPGTREDP